MPKNTGITGPLSDHSSCAPSASPSSASPATGRTSTRVSAGSTGSSAPRSRPREPFCGGSSSKRLRPPSSSSTHRASSGDRYHRNASPPDFRLTLGPLSVRGLGRYMVLLFAWMGFLEVRPPLFLPFSCRFLLQISIEMAAYLALFSVEKSNHFTGIRSK